MAEVTITLANRGGASFRVDRRKPLLDALEAQGMSLPYGCRYGGCISCAAKLLSGEIDQRGGVALNRAAARRWLCPPLRCSASRRLHIRCRRREP
jgi:ferredoxin